MRAEWLGTTLELIPEYKTSTVEPNDWVTPFWSAVSPKAKVFRVNGISSATGLWVPPSGISPSIGLSYASSLSPGNHSILKNSWTASAVVRNILLDYPVQDPLSSNWN